MWFSNPHFFWVFIQGSHPLYINTPNLQTAIDNEACGHSCNRIQQKTCFYYKLLLPFQIITNPKFDANVTL